MGCDKMVSEHFDPRQQMVWSDSVGWYTPSRIPNPFRSLAADRPYSSPASARRPWPFRSIASSSRPVRPSSLSCYGGGSYRQELGVIGLGSSACKIPSRFQSESALEPHLPRQIPDSSDLRRRRGPAELALAVSGPDRREVKVPHSTPGKIPNPSFDLGKMKEWVVSYEEDATDPTAVWRILHLRPSEEPRKVPDQIQPRKMELEMARRVEYPRQSNLNSTQGKQWMGAPEGNFNPPPTGHSAVLSGWGQNQLPPACLVSPNLNHLNPSHGPELAKQCSQYPRELPNQFQFQDQSKQWDPNPSNKRVLSVSTVDDDLSYSNNMKIEQMEQTKVEAKLCSVEYQPRRVPGKEILEQEAEEKKGVNESGDEDKVNKDIAVKTNFVMANVPDEAKFYLTQWYMWKRADKRLRGTGLFWKTPPWPDFCIEELTAVYKSELMKMRHEVEEERMMLQMARVWRVERVQRKLVVAKLTVDSKYAPLNKLQSDLEEFLSFHRGNSVDEEIHKSAEEGGDSRIAKKCLGMLKAMRSHHEYNYVAYRKGIGVVCNKKGGFGVDDRWLWSTGLLWNLPPWPDLSLCEADWRGIEKGAAAMCLRMAAMFGGIVGQEVVQACSRKFHPVYQFSYFGSFESLSVEPLESGDLKPENTIYAVQISTSGSKLQKKLEQAKVFMGGSGALGCEFLKNLALMGIATARMYIDSRCGRCVYFQKPLPEPGFLGAKCNTPMIIPHLTENHGASSDPPEKQAPMCTVHSFPHNIDHCLTWARSEFEGLLEKTPTEVNAFLSNPTGYAVASRTARDQLECVIECLHGEKCETFQDCITWTQLKFEDYLFSRVKQLMFTFPEDSMTNSGTPSWFAPKRPPRPLEFTPTELSQLNLVLTASILRAETFIIPIPYWAFTLSSFTEMFVSKLGVDDIYATAIRNCALESPHMLYVSKMIPASDKSRFFAFGRVFSGKVATGLKVHILDRNYIPGQKKGLYVKSVQCTAIWMEKKQESVEDAPYVNTVAMVGLDQFITKKETPINEKEVDACLIRAMKFTVFPVVYIAVLVLSYSVIMLNIDQHNVRVEKKMTEEDSIRNNRHINDGNDLPREFLSELYYSICRNEIRIIWDQQLLLYQWFLIMLSMKRFLRDVLMAFCQWQSWLHSIILRMYCVILWWHYVASMVMQLKIRIYRLFEAEGGVTLSISVLMVEHIMNFTPQPSNPNSNT